VNVLALILVIISAVLHAGWNLFSKQRNVSVPFFLIACGAAGLVLSPLLWYYRAVFPLVSVRFWIFVLASGGFEALYYSSLIRAYRTGDLSVAYPLIRAVPVILVAVISLIWVDGNQPGGWGLAGIGAVFIGCLFVPQSSFAKLRPGSFMNLSSLFALLAGLGTTGYSLCDDRALKILAGVQQWGPAGPAWFFLGLKTLSSTLALAVLLVVWRKERETLSAQFKNDSLAAAGSGLVIFGAYGLVLAAMVVASNVSYVVAFRQLSIPIGAILGMTAGREPRYAPRLVGIGVIFGGLLLVGLAR
jgi:drug/metabolite transporter (DMT)-like permease